MPQVRAGISRRQLVSAAGASLSLLAVGRAAGGQTAAKTDYLQDLDPVRTELVMNLVVTCSNPERPGPSTQSKDGIRDEIWPIIGGYFVGPGIRGSVVPGGGDFPLVRPDGMIIIDALYRLRTDDGVTIIIHNRGFWYPGGDGVPDKARLVPEFTAPVGRYDWLNRSIFLSTLVDVPEPMRVVKGPDENDRLIQVHRVY